MACLLRMLELILGFLSRNQRCEVSLRPSALKPVRPQIHREIAQIGTIFLHKIDTMQKNFGKFILFCVEFYQCPVFSGTSGF
jgi:hypothetical protein